jgi:Zonula occludens toxin
MPIWLTTGLPGHGKTLRTTLEVEERRVREGRRVYYYGIPELALDWFPLDEPEKWYKVPDGSIVVIDECQRVFPCRPAGSAVPEHVSQFETHRHKGLDVVLITQHPNLIDSHVRRLIERHQHVYRPFGLSYAVIMEWPVATDPQKSGAEKLAQKTRWKLDSSGFKNYKSATVHTIKNGSQNLYCCCRCSVVCSGFSYGWPLIRSA